MGIRTDNVGRYVGLRKGEIWERTERSEYYCGGCGWKVTDHDSYCPECGGALHAAAGRDTDATRERQGVAGTCHVECFDDGVDEALDGEWFSYAPPTWYLSCGHTVEGTDRPKYCAICGKKVVDA